MVIDNKLESQSLGCVVRMKSVLCISAFFNVTNEDFMLYMWPTVYFFSLPLNLKIKCLNTPDCPGHSMSPGAHGPQTLNFPSSCISSARNIGVYHQSQHPVVSVFLCVCLFLCICVSIYLSPFFPDSSSSLPLVEMEPRVSHLLEN